MYGAIKKFSKSTFEYSRFEEFVWGGAGKTREILKSRLFEDFLFVWDGGYSLQAVLSTFPPESSPSFLDIPEFLGLARK